MTHVSHTEQVRLSKRQVAHRCYSLAASEPQYSVSQEQAEMANVSQSGCTEAFAVANVSHSGHHRAGEALHDAGPAHRRDVFCNSEAPEEPVLRQFYDTFTTLAPRERG